MEARRVRPALVFGMHRKELADQHGDLSARDVPLLGLTLFRIGLLVS